MKLIEVSSSLLTSMTASWQTLDRLISVRFLSLVVLSKNFLPLLCCFLLTLYVIIVGGTPIEKNRKILLSKRVSFKESSSQRAILVDEQPSIGESIPFGEYLPLGVWINWMLDISSSWWRFLFEILFLNSSFDAYLCKRTLVSKWSDYPLSFTLFSLSSSYYPHRISHFVLPTSFYPVRFAIFLLPSSYYPLRTTLFVLPSSYYLLCSAHFLRTMLINLATVRTHRITKCETHSPAADSRGLVERAFHETHFTSVPDRYYCVVKALDDNKTISSRTRKLRLSNWDSQIESKMHRKEAFRISLIE